MQAPKQSIVRIVNPLSSCFGSGMAFAGEGLVKFFNGDPDAFEVSRIFRKINDSRIPRIVKVGLRILLCNSLPLVSDRLVFTSHHAPFWRTGRHCLIIHDTISLRFPNQHPFQTLYFRLFLFRLLFCANRVVFISEQVMNEVREFLDCPIPVPCSVIPSIHQQLYHGQKLAGWSDRVKRRELLFIGGRFPHKNLDCLLEAAVILERKYGLSYSIIAHGIDTSLWWLKNGGLSVYPRSKFLRCTERATEGELIESYANATALVFPSLSEGQGMPILEAMSFGCPVLSSDIPVLRETGGDGAFYFDANNPELMAEIIAEIDSGRKDDEVQAKINIGFDHIKSYSQEAIIERWNIVIDKSFEESDLHSYPNL